MKKLITLFLLIPTLCFAGITFDHSDDSVNCGSGASLDDLQSQGGGGVTISVWMESAISGDSEVMVGKISDWSSGDWEFYMHSTQHGGPAFYKVCTGSDIDVYAVGATVSANTITNIIMTWDGSLTATNVHIYKNNVEVGYQTQINGTVATQSDADNDLTIGNSAALDEPFSGTIYEVAIWNVILTAAERQQIVSSKMRVSDQIRPSALKGYWRIDEGSAGTSADGDSVFDYSVNGNTGTGDDGGGDSGLTWAVEKTLSYPRDIMGY